MQIAVAEVDDGRQCEGRRGKAGEETKPPASAALTCLRTRPRFITNCGPSQLQRPEHQRRQAPTKETEALHNASEAPIASASGSQVMHDESPWMYPALRRNLSPGTLDDLWSLFRLRKTTAPSPAREHSVISTNLLLGSSHVSGACLCKPC
jgi:hypothetical protein